MKKYLSIIIIFLIPTILSSKTTYSQEIKLPPLRVSYTDLQNLLNIIDSLKEKSEIENDIIYERIVLRDNNRIIQIDDSKNIPLESNIPESINDFSYNYFVKGEKSITRIELNFYDYERTLRISGNSPIKVDAALYLLQNELEKLSSSIGGDFFIFIIKSISIMIIVIILFFTIALYKKLSIYSIFWMCTTIFTIAYVIFFSSFELLFSGFSAIRGDANFLVKNGPMISFLSLVSSALQIIHPFKQIVQLFKEGKIIIDFK
ncbi:hypothetical protein JWG40_12215 [Leptospira sp. 201903074]|nr:hypothetical protein [Leptospira abararensis]